MFTQKTTLLLASAIILSTTSLMAMDKMNDYAYNRAKQQRLEQLEIQTKYGLQRLEREKALAKKAQDAEAEQFLQSIIQQSRLSINPQNAVDAQRKKEQEEEKKRQQYAADNWRAIEEFKAAKQEEYRRLEKEVEAKRSAEVKVEDPAAAYLAQIRRELQAQQEAAKKTY